MKSVESTICRTFPIGFFMGNARFRFCPRRKGRGGNVVVCGCSFKYQRVKFFDLRVLEQKTVIKPPFYRDVYPDDSKISSLGKICLEIVSQEERDVRKIPNNSL